MAITIKPVDQIATKFAARAQAAGADYKAGVANPRQDQVQAAIAAEPAYEQGVQEAMGQKRFSRELRKAGTAKWQNRSADLGAARYGPGIAAAKQDYAAGVGPYLSTLSALSLPARAPRGSAANIERVRAVADALHQKRVSGGS